MSQQTAASDRRWWIVAAATLAFMFAGFSWHRASAEPTVVGEFCDWTRAESPSPGFDLLLGIDALTPNDAWAVGHSTVAGPFPRTLALHWDGVSWSVVPTPSPGNADALFAVNGTSSRDVWAVGTWDGATRTKTLIEHWDGNLWSVSPSQNPGPGNNFLYDVEALTARDAWAVGARDDGSGFGQTLLQHWDGVSWQVVDSPNVGTNNGLVSIAAVSPRDVWAVGWSRSSSSQSQPLIQHWNGRDWVAVPSPGAGAPNAALSAVVAIAWNDVWAVGFRLSSPTHSETLIEHWDGRRWSIVPSPNVSTQLNILNGAAAVSAGDIWAVGGSGPTQTSSPLALHFDGSAWSAAPVAEVPGSYSYLSDATALPSGQVWASGGTFSESPITATTLVQSCAHGMPTATCCRHTPEPKTRSDTQVRATVTDMVPTNMFQQHPRRHLSSP